MRKILIIGLVLFNALTSKSQIIQRVNGDDKLTFLQKNTPAGFTFCEDLSSQMIETREWSLSNAFVGFYKKVYKDPPYDEYTDLVGYLYFPRDSNHYKKIFIDTFETEASTAEIASIFFANADNDEVKEMFILVKWPQHHHEIIGDLYETRIFDNIAAENVPEKLVYLKPISKKVSGSFDGYQNGKNILSKYKTAGEIRAQLKKLGY